MKIRNNLENYGEIKENRRIDNFLIRKREREREREKEREIDR